MKNKLQEFIKIRVSEEQKLRIENVAASQGISMSDYCRLCIIKQLSDTDEIAAAAARVESLNKLQDNVNKATQKAVSGVKIVKQKE